MSRARCALLTIASVCVLLLAACSGDGPQSGTRIGRPGGADSGQVGALGGGKGTTTTSFGQSQRKRNLQEYLLGLPNKGNSTGAVIDGPAANFADYLGTAELWGTATASKVGDHWEVCGTELLAGCLHLTDFTYDTNGEVQSFSVDGQPLDRLLQWQASPDLTTGDLASVGFHGAMVQPGSNRVAVILSYGWLSDVEPDTTGCDPSKATYEVGGTVSVPCYSRTGASEVFHISVPG